MPTHIPHRIRSGLAIAIAAFLVPSLAYAQAGGGAFPVDQTYTMISNITLIVAQFLNIMTWFVFSFLIFLLDPRFIFDMPEGGGEGSLLTVLNLIWQLSRNLMNVGFAVALVGAAIYTVVTANKEFVNNHLKTFVMAVVLVNFSWFIPRVVFDIANVATATIYSIPGAIVNPDAECRYVSTNVDGCFESKGLPDDTFSCACKAVADFEPFPGSARSKALKDENPAWSCSWAYCIRYVKLDMATSTRQGAVLNGLIVNHARLPQLATITRTAVDDDIADLLLFILRELVVVVIHIALFFPLLALLVALVIRIPILWLTMAFMPFYFLSWVIPDELPLGPAKEYAGKIWSIFIKAAFLPAAVAVPLTIGFIMANAGSHIRFSGIDDIHFNLIDGMGSFGQLLWVMIVLAILWSGTFMVLEMMTSDMPGASGIINRIKSTGEEAGKFAASLPLSTIPIPGMGANALGMASMLSPGGIHSARAALAQKDGAKKLFGGEGVPSSAKLATAAQKMSATDVTELNQAIEHFKTRSDKASLEPIKKFFKDKLPDTGIKIDEGNFHEHILDLQRELEKNSKTLASLNTTTGLNSFNNAANTLRGVPPAAPAGGAPAPAPAGGPPVAP